MVSLEEPEIFYDADDGYSQSRFSGLTGLNHNDYTLNSPLIIDNSLEFHNYLFQNIEPANHLKRQWWTELRGRTLERRGSFVIPHSPITNHIGWANFSLSKSKIDTSEIEEIISDVNNSVIENFPILKAFMKGWVGMSVPVPTKKITDRFILQYGQLFYDCHKISLLLNVKTKYEYNNLKDFLNFDGDYKGLNTNITVFETKSFGKVMVLGEFVWFLEKSFFCDRNFLLMMKDTWLARFNSLLSLVEIYDKELPKNSIEILEEFYILGDKMLHKYGNNSYNAIKLLEPLCLERVEGLASKLKPLIPPFTSFTEHIDKTIDGLKAGKSECREWRLILSRVENIDLVLSIFGSFRHWGHPYIDYLKGLLYLHEHVNKDLDIDEEYAEVLASDLAFKVLQHQFKKKKKWFVDVNLMPGNHPLYDHVTNNTWPTAGEIENIGDIWHNLPLTQCYELPDMIDPSQLYSDKSHSMDKSDVLEHVRLKKPGPIPSKKVLVTLLEKKDTDYKAFLERVDKEGFTDEELITGLKVKEREMKPEGRFFALLSWALREYFVITEYLGKLFFGHLFQDMTVTKDLTELIKLLLETSSGQGSSEYEYITIANVLDYEKWNNYHRGKSTKPVFSVFDKFMGFIHLISMTHDIFEKIQVYFNDRPDLLHVVGKILSCKLAKCCWQGQKGGFEGVRTVFWGMRDDLNLERQVNVRNTKVQKVLQGDNQGVILTFVLPPTLNREELVRCIRNAIENNRIVMDAIIKGSAKLGLKINKDETMQSTDMLVYGKIPIVFGCVRSMRTKRYSRISCSTNDQVPSLSNVLGTVNTACLTVSHFSTSPVEAMRAHLFFGLLVFKILAKHDPTIQNSLYKELPVLTGVHKTAIEMILLYLDPSLGGNTGMSLTRFLIRMFPDPITEGLSFWKVINDNTDDKNALKVANLAYNPHLESYSKENLDKLLEDPLSLNLKKSISISFLLKKEVKANLEANVHTIKNDMIKTCFLYSLKEEAKLRNFLFSITPLFPRFLSEFRAATYMGIVDSITGLITNSVTMKRIFKNKITDRINNIMLTSEIRAFKRMEHMVKGASSNKIKWGCSSTRADFLRKKSWKQVVIGATVPHPLELLGKGLRADRLCNSCHGDQSDNYLLTSLPKGLYDYNAKRGPYPVYLGSKTQESTNIITPWEKEIKLPFLKRSAKLRDSINWFVPPTGEIAQSIFSILKGLTGEDWEAGQEGFRRTGSALHRFSCSRQSSGGYCATNPTKLSRMITTTDTMMIIGDVNYDFMFQSLILYAQISVGELANNLRQSLIYHHHVCCTECLRTIEEPQLVTSKMYTHPDVHDKIRKWVPPGLIYGKTLPQAELPLGNWEQVSGKEGSYHIGRSIGFIYTDFVYSPGGGFESASLLPLSLSRLTGQQSFFDGLLDGIYRGVSLHILHRRGSGDLGDLTRSYKGGILYVIKRLSQETAALSFFRNEAGLQVMSRLPHRVPPSYPLTTNDLGLALRNYLEVLFNSHMKSFSRGYHPTYKKLWVFADVYVSKIINLLILSTKGMRYTTTKKTQKSRVKELNKIKHSIELIKQQIKSDFTILNRNVFLTNHETRSAGKLTLLKCQESVNINIHNKMVWKEQDDGEIISVSVHRRPKGDSDLKPILVIPKRSNPLMKGLRIVQMSTSAHYKLRAILSNRKIYYKDFLCGGDGSGGMTAYLLRKNRGSKGIFNSLLNYEGRDMRGAHPEGPSTIGVSEDTKTRCVNFTDCWKSPSDLQLKGTWLYFKELQEANELTINLMVFDMELQDVSVMELIENNILWGLENLVDLDCTLIIKTFVNYLFTYPSNILTKIIDKFEHIELIQTSYTGLYSTEIYVLCQGKLSRHSEFKSLDWECLAHDVKAFSCFQDQKTEFNRTQKVNPLKLFNFVPKRLIPPLWSELTRLWESFYIPIGICAELSSKINSLEQDEIPEFLLAISLLSTNFAFPYTKIYDTKPSIPSDQVIRKVGTLFCGTLLWLSYIFNDFRTFKQASRFFDIGFPIYFEIKGISTRYKIVDSTDKRVKYKFKNGFKRTWNSEGPGVNKSSRLSDTSSTLAQIIRLYTRCTQNLNKRPLKIDKIFEVSKLFNFKLTKGYILENTSFMKMLGDENLHKDFLTRYDVTSITIKGQHWRD